MPPHYERSLLYYVYFNIDHLLAISLQPSGFDQNIVGQRQDIICSVSIPPEVGADTVEIGWLSEENISDNNRITSVTLRNGSTIFTIIQFNPLAEEDEGEYICYAIINGSFIYESIDLQNFTSSKF